MKIQVFGHKGVLGRAVVEAAAAAGHTVLPNVGGVQIECVVEHNIRAPVVINCAGLVKQSIRPKSEYFLTNTYGVHNLAEACDGVGARLIHVSTDCVFQKGGPHTESSIPNGDDVYALSKRAGEITFGPHLTIRTSFVGFGPRGLLADLSQRKAVTVSQNLLWSGHTVDTIATLLVMLAERSRITGLLHVPGTFQNRYTLARDLKSKWDLPAILDRDDGFVADRRLISERWPYLDLPTLPTFDMQLATMGGPQ